MIDLYLYNFRWGFACLNINNERIKKKCSDYKVRYCCAKERRSYWKEWSEWSECSKSCGGGKSFRARECKNKGHAHCVGPPREEVDCKQINCPGNQGISLMFHLNNFTNNNYSITIQCPNFNTSFSCKIKVDSKFEPWMAWTACSTTCGNGTRIRRRICSEAVGAGKDCPDIFTDYHLYKETEKCNIKLCIGIPSLIDFRQRLFISIIFGMAIRVNLNNMMLIILK